MFPAGARRRWATGGVWEGYVAWPATTGRGSESQASEEQWDANHTSDVQGAREESTSVCFHSRSRIVHLEIVDSYTSSDVHYRRYFLPYQHLFFSEFQPKHYFFAVFQINVHFRIIHMPRQMWQVCLLRYFWKNMCILSSADTCRR